jgi:predicted phosphate transport protein (TIGR00153 family)
MSLGLPPRQDEFYDLFVQAGANALLASRRAAELFREYPDARVTHAQIKGLETEGDRLTREIIHRLNSDHATPFAREDAYALAGAIDDVVDHVEHACDLLGLYLVEAPMDQAMEQCIVLVSAAERLCAALSKLRRLKDVDVDLVAVKRLEDQGDRIVRGAIAALFEQDGISPITIIRWKDIFEALEEAIDACETAAQRIGNIAVKNA